ncbi:GlcNAc-PI de-N-acetylase [Mesobacillus campisalis]|uniref:GlcNAc-PI de-N-acetylase n=1 Tax=Mesobacillus campisalis TaxID=1408103 RepID=A0A0M2T268_9BACI|nr:PIG-L family deacetylase [Mesobacillus campisalis]KKK40076.1 GlcNAc-PI de-N-acetylase [Mesobacillus campisalis]
MTKKVLVIVSHPDDEILGCGGTIKKLVNNGYEVVTVITAKGRKEEEHRIEKCMERANKILGVKEFHFLKLPNLEMHTIPLHQITKEIETLLDIYNPEMILTHHYGDLNKDHQITYQAVLTAARPLPGKTMVELLCFETVSSSEWTEQTNDRTFKPNYFVNISDTLQDKLLALKEYDVEMRPYPHPRSYEGVKSLASVRGMTVGLEHAEAFEVIRRIWK